MPLQNGITETVRYEITEGLADLHEGDRFLCNGAVIKDETSIEAKYYLRIVSLMNGGSGMSPEEAQTIARAEEEAYIIQTKSDDYPLPS